MSKPEPTKSALLDTLLNAPARHIFFVSADGRGITAGQIRASALALSETIERRNAPLYVFTTSAARLCVALLVSALTGRDLILLAQVGTSFCEAISDLSGENALGEFPGPHQEISISDAGDIDADLMQHGLHQPVVTFYTSGSSGKPKLVSKPIGYLEAEVLYWTKRFKGQFDWICGSVSHQHIYGFLFRIAFPVLSGVTAGDEARLSWRMLLAEAQPGRRSLLVSSPAHLTRIASEEIDHPEAVTTILSSGGPLPLEAAETAHHIFGIPPIEIFGSTETGGVAWRQQSAREAAFWTPLDGVRIQTDPAGQLIVDSDFIPSDAPVEMGDRVDIDDQGRFLHKGRSDQIAKIEGKRVSLTRVKETLLANELVEDAAILVTSHENRERLSAAIVPSDAGVDIFSRIGPFRFSRQLVSGAADMLEPAELPKRWRFLSKIPRNAQSKLSVEILASLFEVPRMLDFLNAEIVRKDGMDAELSFVARADLPWFEGHFPGQPILPGLSQLHMAVALAEDLWAVRPGSHNINRLKFNRIVQPGDPIVMQLKFDLQKKRLAFSLMSEGASIASGTIG